MALNFKKIKEETTLSTSPIFMEREKGDWNAVQDTEQTVTDTVVYTDTHGNTYGVFVFKSDPKHFYLCGKVATAIAMEVCDADNGAEFDERGVMILPYKIRIGIKTQCKNDKTKSYLPVEFIGE